MRITHEALGKLLLVKEGNLANISDLDMLKGKQSSRNRTYVLT